MVQIYWSGSYKSLQQSVWPQFEESGRNSHEGVKQTTPIQKWTSIIEHATSNLISVQLNVLNCYFASGGHLNWNLFLLEHVLCETQVMNWNVLRRSSPHNCLVKTIKHNVHFNSFKIFKSQVILNDRNLIINGLCFESVLKVPCITLLCRNPNYFISEVSTTLLCQLFNCLCWIKFFDLKSYSHMWHEPSEV